ncbi:MAG: hypothetical protein ACK5MK_01390 [Dysgonomonas sp.]
MKYKLLLLISSFICTHSILFSQNPADGIYKMSVQYNSDSQENIAYISAGKLYFFSDVGNFSGKVTFTDKKIKLQYPVSFKLETFVKKAESDSLLLRFYDPEMNTQVRLFNDGETSNWQTLDWNIGEVKKPQQAYEIKISKRDRLSAIIFSNYSLVKADYTIANDVSEINFYIKNDNKYKMKIYDWRYGITQNEIFVDDLYIFYYCNSYKFSPQREPTKKAFSKLNADSSKYVSFEDKDYIEYLTKSEDDAFGEVDSTAVELPYSESDSYILTDSLDMNAAIDTTEVISLAEIDTTDRDESDYFSSAEDKYISETKDDLFLTESKTLDELLNLAKEKHKLIRIYYNTNLDMKSIAGGYESNNYHPYGINSYYIVQSYSSRDFKKLKQLKVENTPQILIVSPDGKVQYKEKNPDKVYTELELKDGFLSQYRKYMLQENDRLRKLATEKDAKIEDVKAYLRNTNTVLAVYQYEQYYVNATESYISDGNLSENMDALIFAFDCIKDLPEDKEISQYVRDYLSMNYNYKIQIDKLPEALVYLLKNSNENEKTKNYAEMRTRSAFQDVNINSQIIENAMAQIPNRKDILLSIYLEGGEQGLVTDSLDVKVAFLKKYFDEILPDSVNGSKEFVSTYPYFLNNLAWKVYTDSLVNSYEDALLWVNKAMDIEKRAAFSDTKAHLLYRLNRKQEAIKMQEQAIEQEDEKGNKEKVYSKKIELELMKLGIL